MKILVFAGTTEGKEIAAYLDQTDAEVYVSAATEYGRKRLIEYKNLNLLCGRMDEREIAAFLKEKQIDLVIDATHPFAVLVTENIRTACAGESVAYMRCLREDETEEDEQAGKEVDKKEEDEAEKVICVESVLKAVEYLKSVKGNVFISTGSKELQYYTEIEDYRERCYVRVLSVRESVKKALDLGFEGEHLIAMQGPFSMDLNVAMLKQTKASYFVTKESGKNGGFAEKTKAARETGAVLVVIGRPKEEGMSVSEICQILSQRLVEEQEARSV